MTMAYYTALINQWNAITTANPTFTTAQKLAAVNALTVATPQKAILAPSAVINACVAADLAALTAGQIALFALLLAGSSVDASQGTTIRAGVAAIFAGKTTTLANLTALVAPFDNATTPWWQMPVAQGGGGLSSSVSASDLLAAGNLT